MYIFKRLSHATIYFPNVGCTPFILRPVTDLYYTIMISTVIRVQCTVDEVFNVCSHVLNSQ